MPGVSLDALRELAGFRAEKGCAISLYVDLDPRTAPTAADVKSRLSSLLSEGRARAGTGNGNGLSHEGRVGLVNDLARIEHFFEQEFDRDGARGLAVFSDGPDALWRVVVLTAPVPSNLKLGRELYLEPLVPLVGHGEGSIVAMVGRERGDLYVLRDGRLEALVRHFDEQRRQHDQGGWSQSNYARHIENQVSEHLRGVVEDLGRQVRQRGRPWVVIVTTEETRADLSELLPAEVQAALVGWAQVKAHATPAELLEVASPLLENAEADRERRLLDAWRELAGRDSRSASGWSETLEAASDGRVAQLLYAEGAGHEAMVCPECGRLSLDAPACPLDGIALERSPEGLDLAIHRTLTFGGEAIAVRRHSDLQPVGGIAAILRF